ncbi:hypothetical protein [Methylocella tundrae]|uniref:hypothetical protein n=1 Tax=Methylocella tundrae TaxID=227605 RepID=UPI001FCEEABE|nr:hypothetical protein [Methylocella tundrae]WPP06184.1 hypothetical protein SIN04_10420 [Methylocella tundrae]
MKLVRRQFLFLAGAAIVVPAIGQNAKLTLLIIRHAERPDEAWPGPGLTPGPHARGFAGQEVTGDPRLGARRQLVGAVRRGTGRRRFPAAPLMKLVCL